MCLAPQVASAFTKLLDWPTVNKVVSLPKDLEEGLEPGSARRGAHRRGGQTLARKPWAQLESAWFWIRFSRPNDCFQQLVGFVRPNSIFFIDYFPPVRRRRSRHTDPALREKHLAVWR